MDKTNFKFFSFQDILQSSFQLAQKIQQDNQKFDYIISVNRGGAIFARILSDLLNVKMGAFAMSSYIGIDERKKLKITQKLNLKLKDKKILIVDEIADTGKTFVKAVEHVNEFDPKQIATASLVVKPKSEYRPDYFMHETDKWVVFPYEIRETYEALKDEPESKNLMLNFVENLGLDKKAVENFLK